VSVAVALADKIDTLTGFWAIDEKPTGSKDPFALRRAALGVIRLVLGNGVRGELLGLCLASLRHQRRLLASKGALGSSHDIDKVAFAFGKRRPSVNLSLAGFLLKDGSFDEDRFQEAIDIEGVYRWVAIGTGQTTEELDGFIFDIVAIATDLLAFFHDRLKVFLRDQGIRHDVIDACLAMPGNDDLTLLVKRAQALQSFLASDDGTNLLQGFKRANNILSQAEAKDGVEYSFGADPKFAESDEERALFNALDVAEQAIGPATRAEDFAAAMGAMAQLRAPIDAFFTAVQINTDNPVVRRNRLNLLHRIRAICAGVVELTKVEG
jgi:glycyl-tRNA synthetase beta chain